MTHELADCFYLAVMGGKDECSLRGMTLQMEASWFSSALKRAFDLESLIEGQKTLLERARKVYNAKTIAQEEALLNKLQALRELDEKAQRHALLDLMVK